MKWKHFLHSSIFLTVLLLLQLGCSGQPGGGGAFPGSLNSVGGGGSSEGLGSGQDLGTPPPSQNQAGPSAQPTSGVIPKRGPDDDDPRHAGGADQANTGENGTVDSSPQEPPLYFALEVSLSADKTARIKNTDPGDPTENTPPEPPFPGEKPKIHVTVITPNASFEQPLVSTDAFGKYTYTYRPSYQANHECATSLQIYATFSDSLLRVQNYRSAIVTFSHCEGGTPTAPLKVPLPLILQPNQELAPIAGEKAANQ
ncbi:MAG: hypothetical protein U1F57_09565 [bacterium]